MRSEDETLKLITRRHFFAQNGMGIGAMALCSLLHENICALAADDGNPMRPRAPHFLPKAKKIIFLFMAGAPSQLDLYDYKPKLKELNEKNIPEEMIQGERFAFIKGVPQLLGSPYEFKPYGQSGDYISQLL